MKIIFEDKKEGILKLKVDTLDDIWILSRIIDKNDEIESETTRIVKKTDEQEGKRKKLKSCMKKAEKNF